MFQRLLNIASVVCLVAFVALMGMNVRSYWWCDGITFVSKSGIPTAVGSLPGVVGCEGDLTPTDVRSWIVIHRRVNSSEFDNLPKGFLGFRHLRVPGRDTFLSVPYWFLLLATGLMSAAFWRKPTLRFTLRSLFIATTFLAAVLGMIAWLDRSWIGR